MPHDHHGTDTRPHHHEQPAGDVDPAAFWEDRYAGTDRVWSGRVNPPLADFVADLTPGRVLDLGAGEGGDTVHLAKAGWTVTAVDISTTALARVAAHADDAGVADRVATERHDLAESFPDGEFDLVSAMFLQSPLEFPRERVLRRAAEALVPGGHLIVVDHGSVPPWAKENHPDFTFQSPRELLDSIDLDPARFTPVLLASPERPVTAPDGTPSTLIDTVVAIRRVG